MEADAGIICNARCAACCGPARRTSASDIELSPDFGEREGLLQPITETLAGRSGGPAQKGESFVNSHTAHAAALLQCLASGAASSKSPSMYRTYISSDDVRS